MRRETLGDRFDGRPNAFNLVRLVLALEVLGYHAYSLPGHVLPPRARWFVADVGVDAFLVISGFLVAAAWLRNPRVRDFAAARARRLLPGLWACLAVTAFVIVPLAVTISGGASPSWSDRLDYVLSNAGVVVTQWDLAGTTDPLHAHAWNGSLWTLAWEVACYAVLVGLGIVGLLKPRVLVALVGAAWAVTCALQLVGADPYDGPGYVWMSLRVTLMFGLGTLLYLARDHITFDRRLAGLAAASVLAGVLLSDNYRIVAATGLAYLTVWAALWLGTRPWAVLRSDLSYGVYIYGFPVQQAILLVGWSGGWLPFVLVSAALVLPVAAASWFLVERRFLRRSSRPAPVAVPALS